VAGEEAGIQIPEEIAISMGKRLMENGRLSALNPQEVGKLRMEIAKTVVSSWGVRAPRFTADGGGWIVDLSDVTGDVQFGVIRSTNGQRALAEVVSEDKARVLLKGGAMPDEPGTPGAPEQAPLAPPPPAAPNPGDPRLLVYWKRQEPPEEDGSEGWGNPQIMETTFAEAQTRVLPLLMQGCKVEVWSGKKTPKISVDL
jgi:hypothetical protein